ncbi:MAG: inosine/xanthosine triphosphatase [Thermomicrobium sp.]|nr:inosine/xanthosine triphosphatase [Thermomicrobium sp.]MDW8059081.1 inosine/xanthosine triphosphatase [Thermomicrobium sp.]
MAPRRPVLALGSQQPAKRAAVERVAPLFWTDWELRTAAVPSGVREQPLGDEETVHGAWQRASVVRARFDADYGIGIESGVAAGPFARLFVVSWAVVVDRMERIGIGGAERFPLPPAVAARVLAGDELSTAIAAVLGTAVNEHGGTVAVVSGGRRDRVELLAVALLHAFADLERQRGGSL